MKSTVAKAAAEIRKELKTNFPEIKFTVKSENYAGGNSVNVRYEDGPKEEIVEELLNKYKAGSFNGMEDIYEYNNTNRDIPQAKYLFVNRDMSEAVKNQLVKHITTTYSGCQGLGYNDYSAVWFATISCLVYREFRKMELYYIDFEKELVA
jgi:hypothetical protein